MVQCAHPGPDYADVPNGDHGEPRCNRYVHVPCALGKMTHRYLIDPAQPWRKRFIVLCPEHNTRYPAVPFDDDVRFKAVRGAPDTVSPSLTIWNSWITVSARPRTRTLH